MQRNDVGCERRAAIQSGNHRTSLQCMKYPPIVPCVLAATIPRRLQFTIHQVLYIQILCYSKALQKLCFVSCCFNNKKDQHHQQNETQLRLEDGVPARHGYHPHQHTQTESHPLATSDRLCCIFVVTLFTALAAEFVHCLVNLLVRILISLCAPYFASLPLAWQQRTLQRIPNLI